MLKFDAVEPEPEVHVAFVVVPVTILLQLQPWLAPGSELSTEKPKST